MRDVTKILTKIAVQRPELLRFLPLTGELTGKEKRRAQMMRFWDNSECAITIQTKFGMDMVFDSKNKPTEEFLIFLKIQDGGFWSNVQIDQI